METIYQCSMMLYPRQSGSSSKALISGNVKYARQEIQQKRELKIVKIDRTIEA